MSATAGSDAARLPNGTTVGVAEAAAPLGSNLGPVVAAATGGVVDADAVAIGGAVQGNGGGKFAAPGTWTISRQNGHRPDFPAMLSATSS